MKQKLTLYIAISKSLNRDRNIAKAKKKAKWVLQEVLGQQKANREYLYYRENNYFINKYLYIFAKRLNNSQLLLLA